KHLGISFRHQWLFSFTRFATTAASAPSADPTPFAVEDYLVASCHLTRDKARKVSKAKALSHLKSPSKPDAVLAFLSGLGLSAHDIAAAVARYPPLLVCEIARFVRLDPQCSLRPITISKLQYYFSLFGSFDNVLRALNRGLYLLTSDLERVVKPNVSCLRECGLGPQDVTKICISAPRLLYSSQESIREMVVRAEGIGLVTPSCKDSITAKLEFLKKAFQWLDVEVGTAVPRVPSILTFSIDRLRRVSEFLISEVRLDPAYIACSPTLVMHSLERCLMPWYYVLKFLKAHGLLKRDLSYYTAVQMTEKKFMEKFIHPYTEAAPHLAEDYAAACRGEVASTFRFQELRTGLASV
ncbi:hypothetical protein SETIT_4G096000v2, partial [Setaria italica]